MNKYKRSSEILEMLQRDKKVDVNELAQKLGVSKMTIRRDLDQLSKQYNITRTHGGAVLSQQSVLRSVSYEEEKIVNKDRKEKIAAAAARLVCDGQRIFVDAGSTTRIILKYLPENLNAVIVTNHLKVAEQALKFPNLSVIMLGGEMIRTANCSSGPVTEEQIRRYELDASFLGAVGIGGDGCVYDGFSPEVRFKHAVFSVAKKNYIMVDSSKFNKYALNNIAALSQVYAVITDADIDAEGRKLLKRFNTNVIIAE